MNELEVVLRLLGHLAPAVQVDPGLVASTQFGNDGQAPVADHVLGGAQWQVELEFVPQHGEEGVQRNGWQHGERKALLDGFQLAQHFCQWVNWRLNSVTYRCGMLP